MHMKCFKKCKIQITKSDSKNELEQGRGVYNFHLTLVCSLDNWAFLLFLAQLARNEMQSWS